MTEEARFNTLTKTNFTAACLSIEVVKNKEDTCESLLPAVRQVLLDKDDPLKLLIKVLSLEKKYCMHIAHPSSELHLSFTTI